MLAMRRGMARPTERTSAGVRVKDGALGLVDAVVVADGAVVVAATAILAR